ncbi:CoxG family protein [Thalassococcus sp. S3]|uniref:CoxG family protein n=1 Tax=Thalassococcus sp. S3 TaxID=2017482 RepID=UPI001023FF19|nr:carbon monoxide dehydrogenase subunit G [Thalassococcus sp. S3]QBF30812.1 carbon monoxide dehydrogenase [Thalassococcus sp. S3]
MHFTNERIVNAPIEVVWAGLNDVEVLRDCIPGCEALNREADDTFSGRLRLKIGPVSVRLSGEVHLSDVEVPHRLRLNGKGTGVMGIAKGGADVVLTPEPDGMTRLGYDANVDVGGKIAQLGSRLIGSTANKLAAQFFDSFGATVEAETETVKVVNAR